MKAWLLHAQKQNYIKSVKAEELQHGVQCAAAENPWYDDGVAFDWSQLHSRLTTSSDTDRKTTSPPSPAPRSGLSVLQEASDLFAFTRQLQSGGEANDKVSDFLMLTVIEVSRPWEMQPLSDQAQSWSVFSVSDTEGTVVDGLPPQRLFTFCRGPPGQQSARQDITAVLQNVSSQLRANKIHVVTFLSSFVLFANDFTSLLHQTAAVHKALKAAGLAMNTPGSSFGPRRVLPLNDQWCTLPLESLSSQDDVALFTTDLLFQWLHDSYIWRCLQPIKVFPDSSPGCDVKTRLNARRLSLFECFVRRLLLPKAAAIGFQNLKSTLPEEGGDLLELSESHLRRKRELIGPQKWTILDLRLTLYHVGAYELDPLQFFSEFAP